MSAPPTTTSVVTTTTARVMLLDIAVELEHILTLVWVSLVLGTGGSAYAAQVDDDPAGLRWQVQLACRPGDTRPQLRLATPNDGNLQSHVARQYV